ncbi:MAG TPA: nucleoside triphosphate pyrophosphohydrolase [Rickettsia endosymbiont of Pyrocoelia pectoralis]|nr:nucleoside triphosphate pyrophosphohydrolase [Rickettsia endosymbiont of Pyrocoelia pectoralis]
MTKLVRDLIPEIILKSRRVPVTHIAELDEYKELLKNKLLEEVEEFLQNEYIEEVADILEVLETICNVNNYKLKDILKIKKQKRELNGGFDNKIVLEKITN